VIKRLNEAGHKVCDWGSCRGCVSGALISSSRAIGQRADRLVSPEEDTWSRFEISAAGDAPVPTPSCPPYGCWKLLVVSQNFDSVTPPTLPPAWLATNAEGPPPLWATSNSGVPIPPADTLPNAAFIDDPAVVSDKRLECTFDVVMIAESYVTFRHNFNLEASDVDPNIGFDGGVLEISTDGGNTFQDISDVGGSFFAGGYNRTISADHGSPIAGRMAWSGNSQGFITTGVYFPPLGTVGTLRWRMASDVSGAGEGWRVDTVNIAFCDVYPCPTPTETPAPTPTPPRVIPRPRPTPQPRPTPRL
jgi:hypothetical protein